MKTWQRWTASAAYYLFMLSCVVLASGTPPHFGPWVAMGALGAGLGASFLLAWLDMSWVWDPTSEYHLGMGICGDCSLMRRLYRNPRGPIAQCRECQGKAERGNAAQDG